MSDSGMRAYANPFNAGFGVDPPYMAGRDAVVHRILADLRDGPGRARYITVALGDRGVGKTTIENRLRDYVTTEFGWATLRWTAGLESPFAATLNDAYDTIRSQLTGPRQRHVTGAKIGFNTGVVRADVDLAAATQRPATVAGQLRALGTLAKSNNSSVVVFVDELQAGDPASLAALSAAIQETNGERLPVALVAVGLPTARARLRNIRGATFIERQRPIVIGNLNDSDAQEAFERPMIDAGRNYEPAIFPVMLAAAGGYPYAIQLVGEHTWDQAGDDDTITVAHATRGARLAQDDLDTIYLERWEQLTQRQRDYLNAVSQHLTKDGSAPSNLVASTYGTDTRSAAQTRAALIDHHQLLYSDSTNSLRFALPGFEPWIRRRSGAPRTHRRTGTPERTRSENRTAHER
jgi:AAA ATPase domain